jgi:hypothetical protein
VAKKSSALILILIPCLALAGLLKPDVDFLNYDIPLLNKIENRIKDKVSTRLGEEKSMQDRYFIVPFAYQNKGNDPELSHSFISVIRVLADEPQALTANLEKRKYIAPDGKRDREFEAFTISWLPHDFDVNPNLIVFTSKRGVIFSTENKAPISKGKNFNLKATVEMAVQVHNALGMWGPYEVTEEGFMKGFKRKIFLEAGEIKYRADDRLFRNDVVARLNRGETAAINCYHAIQGLEKIFPDGGLFLGYLGWGLEGTRNVLREYSTAAWHKGMLLEDVDLKEDLYGFVYAPHMNAHGLYNPFKNASAYKY